MNIWTDGGCMLKHPDQPGGWGLVVEEKGTVHHRQSGNAAETTSNRMELTAVIEALRWAHEHQPDLPLIVISDSKLTMNGASQWVDKWRRKGWRTTTGPLKNARLWQDLCALKEMRAAPVSFAWVKGHNGERFNEEADRMATKARGVLIRQLETARREGALL